MPYITVKKDSKLPVRLYYEDWGEGKPIIFIHGWPVSHEMWEYQLAQLPQQGFRCIAYDRRGFGQSDKPWDGYDYTTLANDLKALLDELDLASCLPSLRNVIGLWRSPEQVGSSACWAARQATLTDIYLFGEAGLFGARRIATDGSPALIKPGPHGAPRELPGSSIAGDILLTPRGTLGLRGPMVPVAAYAPHPPPSDSLIAPPPRDFVDTDYAARLDRSTGAINITAPPSGIMAVGGYRFLAQDLQEWARRLGQGALLTALPDRLSGHRLAGRAQDNARARDALAELGLNPLMVEAFRDRSGAT